MGRLAAPFAGNLRGSHGIGRTKNQSGETIPNQIFPVFQDEKELSASHSLESSLHTNLQNSEHLIFLSSPKSANSVYVQNELVYYKQIGKADKIIALILSGEPEYGEQNSENQCFPECASVSGG